MESYSELISLEENERVRWRESQRNRGADQRAIPVIEEGLAQIVQIERIVQPD